MKIYEAIGPINISDILPNNEAQAEIAQSFFMWQKLYHEEQAMVGGRLIAKDGVTLTIKEVLDEIKHRKKILDLGPELFGDIPRVFINGRWYLIYANGNVATEQDPGYTIGRISLSDEPPNHTFTERVAWMLRGQQS